MYKLLVVEDEPLIRRGIVRLIDFDNLEIGPIFEAGDGEEALKIVEKEAPHIILTDINLPYVDGLTFAQKAKILLPDVILIFLTGYDYFDYAVTALKLGADDYILKPVTKKEVEVLLTKSITKLKSRKLNIELEQLNSSNEKILLETTLGEMIKQRIDKELENSSLSLNFLAEIFGYNASYLGVIIKKTLGINFQEYVTEKRIETAKILLLATSLKNYEIAQKIGFDDVNYFSIRFKQITGVSPSTYKKESGK